MNNIINKLNQELQSTTKAINVHIGDLVYVKMKYCKSVQKSNVFSGICISINNNSYNSNITLRGNINKQSVEKQVPIFSSLVESIKVISNQNIKSHKAKLYYLRDKAKM